MNKSKSFAVFLLFLKSRETSTQEVHEETWCEAHYPFQEPVRARPLPIRPDPHLPQGCDVGDLHNEAVLLASLKSGGSERPRSIHAASLRHGPLLTLQLAPCQQPHIKS